MKQLKTCTHYVLNVYMIFLTVLLGGSGNKAYGQFVITKEAQHPVSKDILKGQKIQEIGVAENGPNFIWDLSQSVVSTKDIEFPFLERDSIGCLPFLVDNTLFMLDLTEDKALGISSIENNLLKAQYCKAENVIKYPMAYGDSLSGYFQGEGIYCDKLRFQTFGKYILSADRKGILILPSGDILNDVLQIHTQKVTSNRWYPLDSALQIQRLITEDSIDFCMQNDSVLFHQDRRVLYAKGYRYPIVWKTDSWSTRSALGKRKTDIYFFNPLEQNLLVVDEHNNMLRKRQNLENELCLSSEENGNSNKSVIRYHVMQNKIDKTLTLSYALSEDAFVEGILTDINGITLDRIARSEKKGKGYVMKFHYMDTPLAKSLILYIKIKGETFIEKFIR